MKSHGSWSPSQCLYLSQKQEHTNRGRLWRRGALYESQRKITVSTCYNTDTNIQRTYAHAVIKGEALEWVWCPEQALKAFLRFGTLLKGISAALQKCPSTSPAQSPTDRAAASTQAGAFEFWTWEHTQRCKKYTPSTITAAVLKCTSMHFEQALQYLHADMLTSTHASVSCNPGQPREEEPDSDSSFRCSIFLPLFLNARSSSTSTLAWLKEHLYWRQTDPGCAP